jgi:nitrogen fixation protein FixH
MTTTDHATGKELTGRKVFAIMATGFSIIIGVNVTMAYSAISTFPGLVVKNSYVASQNFDRDRNAQEALALQIAAGYENGTVRIVVDSLAAQPVGIESLEASVGRATHARSDIVLALSETDGVFTAPADLEPGAWVVRLRGVARDGTPFRQDLGLSVLR